MTSDSVPRNTGWSWSSLVREGQAEGLTRQAAEERALNMLQYQTGLGSLGQQYDLAGQLKEVGRKGGGMGTMRAHGAVSMSRGDGKREPGDRNADMGSIRLDIHDEIPREVLLALPPPPSVLDIAAWDDERMMQSHVSPIGRATRYHYGYRRRLTGQYL